MKHAEVLKQFYNSVQNKEPFDWLRGRNFSDGFVICVGAGPWKFGRRKTIQGMALQKLNGRDLSELDPIDWFPLEWQNQFTNNLIKHLRSNHITMQQYCQDNLDNDKLYKHCGVKGYAKVLSLFCRDSLKIDCFPIDRHVKRKLEELNLPTKEPTIIDLCREAGLDPVKVAIAFVREASDMDNPNWSK